MSRVENRNARPITRVIVLGPPLDRSGGIGALYTYATPFFPPKVSVKFIDTRGYSNNAFFSIFPLMKAISILLKNSIGCSVDVVHINFGSRGSAARKLPLMFLCKKILKLPVVAQLHAPSFGDFVNGLHPFLRKKIITTDRKSTRLNSSH